MKGLIWLQRTDAIVSPCENTKLIHDHGVGKIIAEFAGPDIFQISNEFVYKQKKYGLMRGHAYETMPGLLNCKKLIHSVLHLEPKYISDREKNMRETIRNTFEKLKGCDNVSMPLLLPAEHSLDDVTLFVTMLLEQIDQLQQQKDWSLMTVRLTAEDHQDIATIIEASSKLERKTEATATEEKKQESAAAIAEKKGGKSDSNIGT
jgi:O-acetyl-ADP-ribose deacetylase (regulator of RNase III)